jgi:4-aminobutyrate aminotransferase
MYNGSGRAGQSAKNLRQLHCAPLTVRSTSRGIATDAISAENLYAFGVKHVTKGLGRITEGIMTKGKGSYVVYDDGRQMLDFTCGIGVTSLGKLCFLGDDLMPEVAWG